MQSTASIYMQTNNAKSQAIENLEWKRTDGQADTVGNKWINKQIVKRYR